MVNDRGEGVLERDISHLPKLNGRGRVGIGVAGEGGADADVIEGALEIQRAGREAVLRPRGRGRRKQQ